jgi:hypothetical protein
VPQLGRNASPGTCLFSALALKFQRFCESKPAFCLLWQRLIPPVFPSGFLDFGVRYD